MQIYDYSTKEEVIQLWGSGKNGKQISEELSVGYRTVLRYIRLNKEGGIQNLKSKYCNCGRSSQVSKHIRKEAVKMKEEHETWGAEYIRMKLVKKYPNEYIPGARQLRRYFKIDGVVEEKSKIPVDTGNNWVTKAFERVQVDAKEQIKTLDGNWCSYLTFTDEYTGAVLEALVFPL